MDKQWYNLSGTLDGTLADQYGTRSQANDVLSNTPHQETAQPAQTMCAHDDQIAGVLPRRTADLLGWFAGCQKVLDGDTRGARDRPRPRGVPARARKFRVPNRGCPRPGDNHSPA